MFHGLTNIWGIEIFREWVVGCYEQVFGFEDVVLRSGNLRETIDWWCVICGRVSSNNSIWNLRRVIWRITWCIWTQRGILKLMRTDSWLSMEWVMCWSERDSDMLIEDWNQGRLRELKLEISSFLFHWFAIFRIYTLFWIYNWIKLQLVVTELTARLTT